MRANLTYLWYVVRHKWYVYVAGRALGVGRWQLLMHDLTKFSVAEWRPYVDYQPYHGKPKGTAPIAIQQRFDRAWKHHWMENPHHPEYWEKGAYHYLPSMPDHFVREMVADWYGAGMVNHKPDVRAWYAHKSKYRPLPARISLRVACALAELHRRKLIP